MLKPESEYQIQCSIVNYLEVLVKQGKVELFTSIPNSTFTKSWGQKAKNKASGLRPGLPDLTILVNGIPYFVEVKKPKTGVVSKSQKEWIKRLNTKFVLAYIICSLEEFKILINDIISSSKTAFEFEESKYYKADLEGARKLKKLLKNN
jgi:VRR-NUC domain